jgi:hypothetical protein
VYVVAFELLATDTLFSVADFLQDEKEIRAKKIRVVPDKACAFFICKVLN